MPLWVYSDDGRILRNSRLKFVVVALATESIYKFYKFVVVALATESISL
jgi:hypothetical protein